MISIDDKFNVNLYLDKTPFTKIDFYKISYIEMGVVINHTENSCSFKAFEKDINFKKINRYLNNGIYPFYKFMLSKNIKTNKKIRLADLIYHNIQIADICFFESIKDSINLSAFSNNENINKLKITQELFAFNASTSIIHDNKTNINTLDELLSSTKNPVDFITDVINYINSN